MNKPTKSRRRFLTEASLTAISGLSTVACRRRNAPDTSLVILHTNDTHSYLDAFPDDHPRYPGLGGAARRATLVNGIRAAHSNVLLLDSGDIFQGTPYFNLFHGELEFKVMSQMGYDIATLGNHDFDAGVEGLVKQMPHADFEFVSANYDAKQSSLGAHLRPWTTRQFGPLKVGIFGLGIEFAGLVLSDLHQGVDCLDAVVAARSTVDTLRNEGCQFIICLSHLGYRYRNDRISDLALAEEVSGIDLILGGHTHTFLDEPVWVTAPDNHKTMIHQVGWAGIRLGRINVRFDRQGNTLQSVTGIYEIGKGTRWV